MELCAKHAIYVGLLCLEDDITDEKKRCQTTESNKNRNKIMKPMMN